MPSPTPQPIPNSGVPLPPTPAQLQSALDNGIWYALTLWPALHVAVTNTWGGPASADKRDWFAGAVSDLLANTPSTDAEDLEVFLLQVMQDEFECNVEDESEVDVARSILGLKKGLLEGDLAAFRKLEDRYKNRGSMKWEVQVETREEEGEWEGFGDEDEMAVDMDETPAPMLVNAGPPREKAKPEIDDDGFEKVVGRKKR